MKPSFVTLCQFHYNSLRRKNEENNPRTKICTSVRNGTRELAHVNFQFQYFSSKPVTIVGFTVVKLSEIVFIY